MRSIRSASTSQVCRPAGPPPPSWARRMLTCSHLSAYIPAWPAAPPATFPPHSSRCDRETDPTQLGRLALPYRPSFSMAIATLRCIPITATGFSSSPPKQRVQQRRCFADESRTAMPIPASSLLMAPARRCPNTGTSMVPDTLGRAAVPPAPTPIREGRTRLGKCCVSSSSIRSKGSLVGTSQRAPVVRHVAEFPDQLVSLKCRIRDPAARLVATAPMAGFSRQGLGLHHLGIRVGALDGFAERDAVVGRDERQSDIAGHFRHLPHPVIRAPAGAVRAHNRSTLSPGA